MTSMPRRLAPALAVALLGLAALPVRSQPKPVERQSCGDYEITPSGFAAGNRASRVSIQKAGRLMATVTDWAITDLECGDITADAVPELVVRTFSGGAHCCETVRVYALADKPRLLLRYEANNAMGVAVGDINGDGRGELTLGDDSFAYFRDLSYAASPRSLPLVACFREGRFEDCTREFPGLLQARRDEHVARLQPPADEQALQDVKGNALAVVALSALLGQEEQGLDTVRKAVPDERVVGWLAKALPHVRDWMAARGKKLKDK